MKSYLEYKDSKSEKFWEVSVKAKTLTTRWGKLNTQGQTKSKELGSPGLAKTEAEKQKASKVKKGYKEVAGKKKASAKKKPLKGKPSVQGVKKYNPVWKAVKWDRELLSEYRDPDEIGSIRKLKGQNADRIAEKINSIQDGILYLSEPLSLAERTWIFCSTGFNKIKEIRHKDWGSFDDYMNLPDNQKHFKASTEYLEQQPPRAFESVLTTV